MKRKNLIMVILVLIMLFSCTLSGADSGIQITAGEEWSWDPGAYNTFTGEMDLSELKGEELTVRMTSDLPYDNETEEKSIPLFTIVNGKRITMLKQSDTLRCTVNADDPVLRFSGRLSLPEKQHVSRMTFYFSINTLKGEQIKNLSFQLSEVKTDSGSGRESVFYIPLNIRAVTLWTAAAALLVWIFIAVRLLHHKTKRKTGD